MNKQDRAVLDQLTEYLPEIIELVHKAKTDREERIEKSRKPFTMADAKRLCAPLRRAKQQLADAYKDEIPELQNYV